MTALTDVEEQLDGKLQQLKINYPFHSQEQQLSNFSLHYQYIFKEIGDEKIEKYQLRF